MSEERTLEDVKRFIITLAVILAISSGAFWFIFVSYKSMPLLVHSALCGSFFGFSFAMMMYYLFTYVYVEKKLTYLLFVIINFSMILCFVDFQGSIIKEIVPEYDFIFQRVSEMALIAFYIFGIWFSHVLLNLRWGGLLTRITYIITLGIPLIVAVMSGHIAETWYFMLVGIPYILIFAKSLTKQEIRHNPSLLLYIIVVFLYSIMPFLILFTVAPSLFIVTMALWTLWILVQVLLMVENHGETKQREMELTQKSALLDSLNRTKTEFFSNLNHEMKTPLTVISTDIQLAQELIGKHYYTDAAELLNDAQMEIIRMAKMVNTTLQFTGNQEKRQPMTYIDIGALVTSTLSLYRPLAEKRGNTLTSSIPDELPEIYGSADLLSNLLVNLLANANAHVNNGTIQTDLALNGEKITISLKDNGSGIDPELMPHIFERGVTDGKGQGLGLSIVKSIVQLHGGEINIWSKPEWGTEVTFTLPTYRKEIGDDE